MNCVRGVTKVFLASSPPRRRWTSVGGWSWCTGSIACQRTGRWCHRSWRSSAWPRPCSRRPSWRSALRRSSSRPNTGWTSAPWASTPGMFPPARISAPSSQLSTPRSRFSWLGMFSSFGIRGKLVLGFSEVELLMKGSGYNFIHAADMMYCADTHIRSKSDPLAVCRDAATLL